MAQLGEITAVQQASDWFIPASTSFTVDVYFGDVTIQVRRTSATDAMYVGDVVMGQSREITIRGPVSCPLGVDIAGREYRMMSIKDGSIAEAWEA